ncbi:MAG: glycine cleavage system protein R [Thermosulfidibacteraceae bacterium]|jgi:glycine cleavage system transcriptional repressor
MPKYVLFAVGKDRPGIVASITGVLYNYDCNLEDSSMTILRDQFAIILVVDVPESTDVSELENSVNSTCRELSLFYVMKPLDGDGGDTDKYYTHCIIKVFGEDRTGIVYRISKVLAEKGVNICDLRTKITSGDRKLYAMIIETEVPYGVTVEEIEEELKRVGEELNVDVVVEEVPVIRL